MPKPVNRERLKTPTKGGAKRPATIYVDMWAPKGRRLWTYLHGERFQFDNSASARSWASKHGFDGVRFTTQEG